MKHRKPDNLTPNLLQNSFAKVKIKFVTVEIVKKVKMPLLKLFH